MWKRSKVKFNGTGRDKWTRELKVKQTYSCMKDPARTVHEYGILTSGFPTKKKKNTLNFDLLQQIFLNDAIPPFYVTAYRVCDAANVAE